MSEFTPTGRMIIHTDWDVRPGKHGATSGDVWARAVVVETGRKLEFAGTQEQVTDWAFAVMAAAGERGVAVELRDARG